MIALGWWIHHLERSCCHRRFVFRSSAVTLLAARLLLRFIRMLLLVIRRLFISV